MTSNDFMTRSSIDSELETAVGSFVYNLLQDNKIKEIGV